MMGMLPDHLAHKGQRLPVLCIEPHTCVCWLHLPNSWGVGFDDIKVEKGFGLDLIDVFTSQMDSNFTLITSMSNGVKYTFSIPVN